MKKLRLSYTLLKLWQQGRVDDALMFYFKMPMETSKAMQEGKAFDDRVNIESVRDNALPAEFGGDALIAPRPQVKLEASYNEQFDLVGIIDVLDEKTLYEIKTGKWKDSGEYANDFQVALYLLLAELNAISIDRAIIIHHNQHNNTTNRTLIWNTEFERNRARNYIDSLGPDMWEYFEQNGLFTTPPVLPRLDKS